MILDAECPRESSNRLGCFLIIIMVVVLDIAVVVAAVWLAKAILGVIS